jgi:hypothetical protein
MKQKETFSGIMQSMSAKHGSRAVFSDFLHLCICAFSLGQMEDEYMKTISRYQKPEVYRISEALGALVIEMTGDGTGLVDVLGAYFEEFITHGHNGQFFTPQHICDLIAHINYSPTMGQRIHDPACGSGRLLMAMAKLTRHGYFYGADCDVDCAKMTAINMVLNGMFGEVAWMNSLSQDWFGGWKIEPSIAGCPRITPITENQSYIKIKLPEKEPLVLEPAVIAQTQKQLVFEF